MFVEVGEGGARARGHGVAERAGDAAGGAAERGSHGPLALFGEVEEDGRGDWGRG